MRKVLLFSLLLVAGMAGSQLFAMLGPAEHAVREVVRIGTMLLLSFIMVHVGYEFEIDRTRLGSYGVDYLVAATAAAFPWIFSSVYFLVMLMPEGSLASFDAWSQALLAGRFAAPTSAGVLFSMLAAAGLSATWVFRKARVLAIFDDLDTVLLMIPLKMMLVGVRWQLGVIVAIMGVMLWAGWRGMRRLHAPVTWPWVMGYSAAITLVCEVIYEGSKLIDDVVPVHVEVLLPAFVLGCMLAIPAGADPHRDDAVEGHLQGPEDEGEQRVTTIVSAVFMALVGLSMPEIDLDGAGMTAPAMALHVLAVTVLSNVGKMFPVLCYREEASVRERLALCIGMWPRGEVGAGILLVSISYGIGGAMVSVATFSLALNLVLTGIFILAVQKLLDAPPAPRTAAS